MIISLNIRVGPKLIRGKMSSTAKEDTEKPRHVTRELVTQGSGSVRGCFHVRPSQMSSKDASGVWEDELPQATCEKGCSS